MFRFGSKRDLRSDQSKCTIKLLHDKEILENVDFERNAKGQVLLDHVFRYLGLTETDFFGLRFIDHRKEKAWLDATRPVLKQVKGLCHHRHCVCDNERADLVFSFRVKFYPADATRVKEELTRFLMYLQLRRDLIHGRLQCEQDDMAFLLACVVQSELGDFDPVDHKGRYVYDMKILPPNKESVFEERVTQLHQTDMKGQTPAEAELAFLKKACSLDTYGIDPFFVKDHKGNPMHLGINHSGISVMQMSRRTHHYSWKEIQKITYEGRMFIIHIVVNDKKMLMGYKCNTASEVHFLWRTAIEQKYFFTSSSSSEVPVITAAGGLFAKTVKVRYSGRVEKELLEDGSSRGGGRESGIKRSYSTASPVNGKKAVVGRASTLRRVARVVPGDANDPLDRSFCENAYLNYSAFSETTGDAYPTNHLNSSHPVLQHMHAFDEDWETSRTGTNLHTEFNMRPDLTPTSDGNRHSLTFQKPDLEGSPSFNRRDDLDSRSSSGDSGRPIPNNHVNHNHNQVRKGMVKSVGGQVFAVIRTSILSFLLLMLIMSILFVIIIETDSEMFSHLRKLPEMIVLRQYYDPLRNGLLQSSVIKKS